LDIVGDALAQALPLQLCVIPLVIGFVWFPALGVLENFDR